MLELDPFVADIDALGDDAGLALQVRVITHTYRFATIYLSGVW